MSQFFYWFLNSNLSKILFAGVLVCLAVWMINGAVRRFFSKTTFLEERKEKTIESMVSSLTKFVGVLGFLFYCLSLYVDNLSSLLAGAGMIGVVVGFGAQSLIKDLLSGLFFLYEKQLHKGDFVKINSTFTGTVEEIGFRALKVREWSGKLLTISNGAIKEIQNYNMERMRVIEHVTTSFYQSPADVERTLEDACGVLNETCDEWLLRDGSGEVVEPFQLYGMTSLNENHRGYQYTVVGLVKDDAYFLASQKTRKELANALFQAGIQMAEDNTFVRTTK